MSTPIAVYYGIRCLKNGLFLAVRPLSRRAYSYDLGDEFSENPRLFTERRHAEIALGHCEDRHPHEQFEIVPVYLMLDKPVVRVTQRYQSTVAPGIKIHSVEVSPKEAVQ